MIKVENMVSSRGNAIANQFIIRDGQVVLFQSYDSVIVRVRVSPTKGKKVQLDINYWDYSRTTGKYRNQFLNESKKDTQRNIDSGTYKLTNLNK